jgi:hypothetical protein
MSTEFIKEQVNSLMEINNPTEMTVSALANNMLASIQDSQVMSKDDFHFLADNKQHLQEVMVNTYIWRTDLQKMSIISDDYFPTIHAKFHQSILEQKVQFEQAVQLAKEFEDLKLDMELLTVEIEELEQKISGSEDDFSIRKDDILKRKKLLELGHKKYQLQQSQVAMMYRMKEVKGWKNIQEDLLRIMREDFKLSDDEIWNKEHGEIESAFFLFLTNFKAVDQSKDTAEINNLFALARFGVDQAMQAGIFEKLLNRCNQDQVNSLIKLGYIIPKKQEGQE